MKQLYSSFKDLTSHVAVSSRQLVFLSALVLLSISNVFGQINNAPVASNVSFSITNAWGSWQAITPLIGTDAEGDALRYKIVSLPSSGSLSVEKSGGTSALIAGQEISTAQLYFKGSAKDNGTVISFSYLAIDARGLASASAATYTIYVGLTPVPAAISKITNPIFNLGDQAKVLLGASGGSVVSYRINNPPSVNQGKLYLLASTVLTDLPESSGIYVLSVEQANQLVFIPNTTFTGIASFTYEAGDALTNVRRAGTSSKNAKYSAAATYSIPVIQPSPLPVELIGFSALASKAGVSLTWKTVSEKENDYFQVERSMNGNDFISIGRVDGHGTSNVALEYSFLDKGLLSGTTYYRLKQVDYNGQSEYSKVEAVKAKKVTPFSLGAYPNPTQDKVVLNLLGSPSGAVTISLFQTNGLMILQNTIEQGQPLALDLTNQASGVYFAQVQTSTGNATVRIVKK